MDKEMANMIINNDFPDEESFVSAIKTHLLTPAQEVYLDSVNLTVADVLNGRFRHELYSSIDTIFDAWNRKLGSKAFGFLQVKNRMNPNDTLRRMLALVEYMNSHAIQFSADSLELADCVTDLNDWILKGGFLPGTWEVAQIRARSKPLIASEQ